MSQRDLLYQGTQSPTSYTRRGKFPSLITDVVTERILFMKFTDYKIVSLVLLFISLSVKDQKLYLLFFSPFPFF